MQVYRERTTPLCEVSPDLWRQNGLMSPIELEACVRGTQALTAIIEDLKDELQRPRDMRPTTRKDAANLITLVSYFLYEPLARLWYDQSQAPTNYPHMAEYTEALDGLYSRLYDALIFAQRTLHRDSSTRRMIQQVYEFSISHYYEHNLRFMIPAFSPLELLLRVVTTREQWDDHEPLFQAYRKLEINRVKFPGNCIPRVGFSCLGIKTNASPTCVLAFSADYWKGFNKMNNFIKNLRDSRRHFFVKAQLREIVRWSKILDDRYQQDDLHQLITNPPGSFDHEDELASPFYCRNFTPRDRCTRCQALFKYAVTQVVRGLEADKNLNKEGREPFKNWSYAEVYAHFFCQELNQNG